MPADTDPKPTAPETPFARKPVTWGRPPAVTFRAGPLPKATDWPAPPTPAAGPRRAPAPGGSILGGSMIPQPAPKAAEPVPAWVEPVEAVEPATVAPVLTPPPAPDLTVRPLPLAEVEPTPAPMERPAAPAETEAPMVSSSLAAATARKKPSGRLPLYAGGAAAVLAIVAAGVWFAGRSGESAVEAPASEPVTIEAATATPAAPTTPTVIESAPAATPTPTEASAAPRVASAPTPTREVAVRPSTPPAASRPSTPTPASTPVAPPPPAIETAPLVIVAPTPPAGPPPTAAERPSQDPDAPVATRPQPLEGS